MEYLNLHSPIFFRHGWRKYLLATIALSLGMLSASSKAAEGSVAEALTSGKVYGDIRLRYESVDQDNPLDDATALTVRTRLGYSTGSYEGFSALVEFEDSRIVAGVDDFSVPPIGFNLGSSIIADPETTEIDQGYIQYKNSLVTARVGAQVIALDNQRFIGHVGWRQDRVTFDAVSATFTPTDKLKITAAHLFERNRLFGEVLDQESKDNIVNITYPTKIGKLNAYAYLLEDDFGTNISRDTYGLRLAGARSLQGTKVNYVVEYADQSLEDDAGLDFSMDYIHFELSAAVQKVRIKVGMESLGSDAGGQGFFTPLGTVHKFNGFSDQFVLYTPAVGLVDVYVGASRKVGPGMLSVVYHDFSADEGTASVDDLGNEINVTYGMKFGKRYNAGIKYAKYEAEDNFRPAGAPPVVSVDTEKVWIFMGLTF